MEDLGHGNTGSDEIAGPAKIKITISKSLSILCSCFPPRNIPISQDNQPGGKGYEMSGGEKGREKPRLRREDFNDKRQEFFVGSLLVVNTD